MKARTVGRTLVITGVKELSRANAVVLQNLILSVLREERRNLDLDLSETLLIDAMGVSTLLALRTVVREFGGSMRLVNLNPVAKQFLDFTRATSFFDTITSDSPELCTLRR